MIARASASLPFMPVFSRFPRRIVGSALALLLAAGLAAEPLSRKTEIDFFADAPSRNLKGLAARSDGRLVAGPVLTELTGTAPADILWCVAPTADASHWLVGTGPEGKIFELTIDAAKSAYTSRELVKLDESQVFSLLRLANGDLLAATSPRGALCLIRDGKLVARVGLPVDSLFDLLPLDKRTVLVATGNPGRIYRVDLKKFSAATVLPEKLADEAALASHGIALFGEVRDRNVRRLAQLADGRIAAGSAPRGNLYAFPHDGGAPVILQENRDAEVTDLLAEPNGDLYAALTYSANNGEFRITPPAAKKEKDAPETVLAFPPAERFSGRSALVKLPAGGFPEILAARNRTAFYRLARHGDQLVISGGEQGELLGYDLNERLSLTFAGSASSQLNGLAAVPGQPDRFLVLRNNAPGFALLDFAARTPRSAETRRIDLESPAQLGALQFNRLRHLDDRQLAVEIKTSNGSDELEGWTPWTPLVSAGDGWRAEGLRGRYLKLRLALPADSPADLQIDKASLYALPQNRRPQLQEFRLLPPNFGLVPSPAPSPSTSMSLSQLMQAGGKDDDKHAGSFLASQVVPMPGAQIAFWQISDPDGDNLLATFSLRRDGDTAWTDLAVNSAEPYVQFGISHLPEGVYFTRLVVSETEPRLPGDRLTTDYETDDLVIDHTPPAILEATARRDGDHVTITVHGRDALSLLGGLEATFNNGAHAQTEQPLDGIRDGREETFVVEVPLPATAGATSVEVGLYDAAGNTATRRIAL